MESGTMVLGRTLEQRHRALQKANHIRVWRAQMKRDVKHGRRSIAELLASPPEELESMPVLDLLLAAPRVGRVKAMKMLHRAQVGVSKTVGGLSARQQSELLAMLAMR